MSDDTHAPKEPKKRGRAFLPGHGIGRPKLPEDLKQVAKLTKTEAKQKLINCLKMTSTELNDVVNDEATIALDAWVARIVLLGIHGGDERRLGWMFDRLFGKVEEKVEVTTFDIDQMKKAEIIDLGEKAIKYLKDEL